MEANVIEMRARARRWHETARARRRMHAHPPRAVTREQVVDGASRVLLRRGYQGLLFGGVARELGVATRSVIDVISDKPELVRACYRRSAEALDSALMAAETTTGSGIQKLDAFLGAVLAWSRECGCLLALGLADGPTAADVRWCRDKDRMTRTRLERLIRSGQRDGSIKAREPVAACQLILALLHAPDVPRSPGSGVMPLDEWKQLIFGGLAAR